MKKLIIEARINEFTGRDPNPHVPWSVEEIVDSALAAAEAGASIVHFHVRGPNGEPDSSYEKYQRVVEEIRRNSTMLIHPTLGVNEVDSTDPEERIAHVRRLAGDGLTPELAPLDFVTSNVDFLDPETQRFIGNGATYVNTATTLEYFAEHIRTLNVKPYAVVWSIPSLRMATSFMRSGLLETPAFLLLTLSSDAFPHLHPGTIAGLEAYLPFLPSDVDLEWSVSAFGVSLTPMAETIVSRGGHLALGLGDYHYKELGLPTNAALVQHFADLSRNMGREIASPDETRQMLGIDTTDFISTAS